MKTALDVFLEQIVLKQVEGSVYLIPAITDVQVQEIKNLFKQQIIDAHSEGVKFITGNTKVPLSESIEWYNKKFGE